MMNKGHLEKELFSLVRKNTPNQIQKKRTIDFRAKKEFSFVLTKEIIKKYHLWEWFKNYKKEAMVSTGGIRGPQNILFPWDARFPINVIGIVLATLGKSLVLKGKSKKIEKIAGCEVRYNSNLYVEIISRVQAAQGITTHVPVGRNTIPIWLVSFLIFKLDLDGGEHVTSSHAVSTKTATKDLNDEGSQFMPEESLKFVDEIEKILKKAETKKYEIKISSSTNPLITEKLMESINDGVDMYVEYLKNGVATPTNINLVRNNNKKIMIDCVGGCMYITMAKILNKLEIDSVFGWFNAEEDPFFHGIGKVHTNPKTKKDEYFDYSCDATIMEVAKTLGYESKLKKKAVGTVVEITDPDGDRLVAGEVESLLNLNEIEKLGIPYIKLDEKKVFTIYTPTQLFLMIMDFQMTQLKSDGLWGNHPRFIIKTTASSLAWDEWAEFNNIKIINVPVGIKEIASMMKKVERQIIANPDKEVIVKDIFGRKINLGVNPRLLFGGEESGGMIMGPEELIKSGSGRIAIAMREKSAGEAIIIVAALASYLHKNKKTFSDYLGGIFSENKISGKYDIREEVIYYNESNPNPVLLDKEKKKGEVLRDKNDNFFIGIALAIKEKKNTFGQGKEILSDALKELNFSDLNEIAFVGDGTFLRFYNKIVEVRKSGTDAKTKAYSYSNDKEESKKFANAFANYSGKLTHLYKKYIGDDYLRDIQKKKNKYYLKFLRE